MGRLTNLAPQDTRTVRPLYFTFPFVDTPYSSRYLKPQSRDYTTQPFIAQSSKKVEQKQDRSASSRVFGRLDIYP